MGSEFTIVQNSGISAIEIYGDTILAQVSAVESIKVLYHNTIQINSECDSIQELRHPASRVYACVCLFVCWQLPSTKDISNLPDKGKGRVTIK